jgi:hypothetical protein
MGTDPIVDEVRAVREALAARYGFNVRKIVQALERRPAGSGEPVVTLEPKRRPRRQRERKAG